MRAMTSVAPGNRNVLTRRNDATRGMTARANGTSDRPTRAAVAVAMTIAMTTSGPVQPRTPKATAASAKARTSFVLGFRA